MPKNGSLFFTIFQTFMSGPPKDGKPSPYFGERVYIYSLKDGINDGFLTPFRVKQIATTLDEYVYTPDDTLVEGGSRSTCTAMRVDRQRRRSQTAR